eukprot:657682-Pyramimonas_sp.AAC.1
MRGANLLRRGRAPAGMRVVHLVGAHSESHRLQIRSSYSAETLASAPNLEDCYTATVEMGGRSTKATLPDDAEHAFKSLSRKDLEKPTECALLGHISWMPR